MQSYRQVRYIDFFWKSHSIRMASTDDDITPVHEATSAGPAVKRFIQEKTIILLNPPMVRMVQFF
jgi:hypothetical protein